MSTHTTKNFTISTIILGVLRKCLTALILRNQGKDPPGFPTSILNTPNTSGAGPHKKTQRVRLLFVPPYKSLPVAIAANALCPQLANPKGSCL